MSENKKKNTPKTALITGITGQDGAYLASLLLEKNYQVHGLRRRTSLPNTQRLDQLNLSAHPHLTLHDGDMTDSASLTRLVMNTKPDEVYNLAAQSHVKVSFDAPEYTANADALGTLRMLEALRLAGLEQTCRFFQAATSELYGATTQSPQNEATPFAPRSPYAIAKLYAYWTTVNYREAYGIHASNAIMFNHESPLRGHDFVTRKITRAVARIHSGRQDTLQLGNIDAKRDWTHARDIVHGMWLILQQERPDDYVLASGQQYSVREFAAKAFAHIGIEIAWQGHGVNEVGIDQKSGKTLITINPAFYRPAEVETLLGDSSKARKKLNWHPEITIDELVTDMMAHDLKTTATNTVCAA